MRIAWRVSSESNGTTTSAPPRPPGHQVFGTQRHGRESNRNGRNAPSVREVRGALLQPVFSRDAGIRAEGAHHERYLLRTAAPGSRPSLPRGGARLGFHVADE